MDNSNPNRKIDWKRYLVTLLITAFIFVTAFSFSNNLSNKRIQDIKRIQDSIATDILSSETQFSLLSELSCKDVGTATLSQELNSIAERIQTSANSLGNNNQEVIFLKKYYSLLEIKDYLLMRRISAQCGEKFMFALYFYDNEENCPDCDKAGYVLTYLRSRYPQLRVYSFDRNLDVSAVKTLRSIFGITEPYPAFVFGDKTINGYKEKEEMEKILQDIYPKETKEALAELKRLESATTTKK
jgi:hypothetical protein